MRIIHIPSDSIAAYILLFTRAGTRNEFAQKRGIAHLTEHVLLDEMESRIKKKWGMTYNAYTRKEFTTYVMHCIKNDLPYCIKLFGEFIKNWMNLNNSSQIEAIIDSQKHIVSKEENRVLNNNNDIYALNKIQSQIMENGLDNGLMDNNANIEEYSFNDIQEFMNSSYKDYMVAVVGGTEDSYQYIYDTFMNTKQCYKVKNEEFVSPYHMQKAGSVYNIVRDTIQYSGRRITKPISLKEHISFEILTETFNMINKDTGRTLKYFVYSDQAMVMEIISQNPNSKIKKGLPELIENNVFFNISKDRYIFRLTELLQMDRFIADFAIKTRHLFNESGKPDNWLEMALEVKERDIISAFNKI